MPRPVVRRLVALAVLFLALPPSAGSQPPAGSGVVCRFEVQFDCTEGGCEAIQPPLQGELSLDLAAGRGEVCAATTCWDTTVFEALASPAGSSARPVLLRGTAPGGAGSEVLVVGVLDEEKATYAGAISFGAGAVTAVGGACRRRG